jgi:hypothetical protein
MFYPTTAERESINVDLYDIANMEWEQYSQGEPSSDATEVEEPIIRQLMSFQEYQNVEKLNQWKLWSHFSQRAIKENSKRRELQLRK